MALDIKYNKKSELYNKHLNTFNDVKITYREVDIIACVLHNRGEKKIASILDISPRTVSNHIRNIMIKLGHNSRENIIDFAEKSGKLNYFKEYYFYLILDNEYHRSLNKIKLLANKAGINYNIVDESANKDYDFIEYLKEDLKRANFNLSKSKETLLFIVTDNIENINLAQYNNQQLIVITTNTIHYNSEIKHVKFNHEKDYPLSVIELIMATLNNELVKEIAANFREEFFIIQNSWNNQESVHIKSINNDNSFLIKNRIIVQVIVLISILLCATFCFKYSYLRVNEKFKVKSNLILPSDKTLLNRDEILKKIDQKFSNQNNIEIVTLIGIGGVGKTTTAREYAKKYGNTIVWEVNARTKQTIANSIQNLAYALCQTPQERNFVNQINSMTELSTRQSMLFSFLSKIFRANPNWLLVYDNVVEFENILNYIPHDKNNWGSGRILITTVNHNISSNYNISEENIINIGELTPEKSYDLFSKIISLPKDKLELCLKKIPPFPLDISVAAHYIKETNIDCNQYLKHNQKPQEPFITAQTNILKDKGGYNKTRYDIISMSIDLIMQQSQDFKDLLFLISTIDYKNIPKELLYNYKDQITVDNFLHELKKFSIINQTNTKCHDTFSIHASTQEIMTMRFQSGKYSVNTPIQLRRIAQCLNKTLSCIIKSSDINKMHLFIPHLELFINYKSSLSEYEKSKLYKHLGLCYFTIGKYKRSLKFLTKTYSIYQNHYGKKHISTAKISTQIAAIHRNMGNFIRAETLLERALPIYIQHYGKNHENTAWLNICLGGVYRVNGKYIKAEKFLLDGQKINLYRKDELNIAKANIYIAALYKAIGRYQESGDKLQSSLNTYIKFYGNTHPKTACVSIRLASFYRTIGEYNKAAALLEQAKDVYQKYFGEDSLEMSWCIAHIGILHKKRGYNQSANDCLQQSLASYNRHLNSDNVIVAWVKYNLACVEMNFKNYVKATELLNDAIKIYNKQHKNNMIKASSAYRELGRIRLRTGDFAEARKYFLYSYEIFNSCSHPEKYKSLELLADLALSTAETTLNKQEKMLHIQTATQYLKKAIDVINPMFSENSANLQRIKVKYNLCLKKEAMN
ncbi:MAG: hypothetical protein DGJ47_000423 [Rickettsiaceae bacterium]